MAWGEERIAFLEIDQPLCSLTYGEAPCQAVLGVTGAAKCHNSRFTCQDAANYTPGTLTLRFSRDQLDILQYGNVIPGLRSFRTTPMSINLGGMEESVSAFGKRETVTLALDDHKYDDHLVDKYRLERSFVPAPRESGRYARYRPSMFRGGTERVARAGFFGQHDAALHPYNRGTFWGKWLARNPYHSGYPARVRMGTVGQALADMRVRNYVVDRIEGPANGQVRVVLKDLFSLVEAKKAVAPFASLGELSAAITGTPATFSVLPSGIGNLPESQGGYASITAVTSGHVAIGDEIIQVTRSGDTFTVVARGALNTTQQDHAAEDLVQLVLSEVAQLGHDIIYRLLTVHGGIPSAQINKTLWDQRAQGLTELYTGRITTPTPVNQLVGELMLQAGCTVWPDTATGMIDFVALQAGAVSPTVNDEAWIAEGGSLSIKRQDDKRVSQVHVYYGQINPAEDLDDKRNFRSRAVTVDLAAEGAQQYGTPVIREIFSRWIPQFGRQSAERVGDRLIAMFRDAPHEAMIPLHASRDGQVNLARYFSLETAEIQDAIGAVRPVTMAPVEIDRGETAIEVRAQQVTFETLTISGDRVIYIENDAFNLNLRDIHDSIYSAPTGSEVIRFIVLSGVTVGSTSTSSPGITTGSWPAGVALTLQNDGRIQGKGGAGGAAGGANRGTNAGAAGGAGGPALEATYAITVDNTNGEIWAGDGGGGGGGATYPNPPVVGGGGGGGGAGTEGGAGGAGGTGAQGNGASGAPGSADVGGAGGAGGSYSGVPHGGGGGGGGGSTGGAGGSGYAAGASGTSSAGGTGGVGKPLAGGPGGSGGAIGNYIVGDSFVTWTATGSRRGGTA